MPRNNPNFHLQCSNTLIHAAHQSYSYHYAYQYSTNQSMSPTHFTNPQPRFTTPSHHKGDPQVFNASHAPLGEQHHRGGPHHDPDSLGATHHGMYPYTRDLLMLDSHRPPKTPVLPDSCKMVTTPLRAEHWEEELAIHPDTQFTQYVVDGIKKGFRIGYQHGSARCAPATGNMASASQHPGPVVDYLEKELAANRVVNVPHEFQKGIQVSRFGVIPKSSQPGKWRLILDLSSPEGRSVNDGIDPVLCSMSFATVDSAVARILDLGRNTLLAKLT